MLPQNNRKNRFFVPIGKPVKCRLTALAVLNENPQDLKY